MEFSPPGITDGIRHPATQPKRILVIDDDPCVGAAIGAILAGFNYETVHESRAYAGIQTLRQSVFDVVMIDIFLPGLSGLDAIGYVRSGSSIPIIAMSGFRLRSSIEPVDYLGMATQRGATLCMRKPFRPAQLIEAVDSSGSLRPPIKSPIC
ncbi:response regulator [Bradyrhizobium sp.]|uniref:response regulator n=1 Tax=Bradyrhizobium sp. TaxID=376 RepID=UPI003C5CB40F